MLKCCQNGDGCEWLLQVSVKEITADIKKKWIKGGTDTLVTTDRLGQNNPVSKIITGLHVQSFRLNNEVKFTINLEYKVNLSMLW